MKIKWNDSLCTDSSYADIGNYIRLQLYPRGQNNYYALYLHIRKWKEDGCIENKLCQKQEVAGFSTDNLEMAKTQVEQWFNGFVKDIIGFGDFSLGDLL